MSAQIGALDVGCKCAVKMLSLIILTNLLLTSETLLAYIDSQLDQFEKDFTRRSLIYMGYERIVRQIVNVIQSQLGTKGTASDLDLTIIKQEYRNVIRSDQQTLIPMHLFSMILLNTLQNEADELGNVSLKNIWSGLTNDFIEISLEENMHS